MDEKCPGLSAGIFMGRGNYNQDLSPRSILVEVGTHTNSKEDAQRGIEMFAQVLPMSSELKANRKAMPPRWSMCRPLETSAVTGLQPY